MRPVYIVIGILVLLYLAQRGVQYFRQRRRIPRTQMIEGVRRDCADDVAKQFMKYDEWEQETIIAISDTVEEFERTVRMWK